MTFYYKKKRKSTRKNGKKRAQIPNPLFCAVSMTKRDIHIAHMKCDIAPCIYGCHSDFMAKD